MTQPRCAAEPTGRAVIHLALVRLGVGDELLECIGRKILAGDQDQRNFRDQRHRRKIGDRVIGWRVAVKLRIGVGGNGSEQCRVTVRLGADHAQATDRAAASADVLDHHALAEDRRHALRHDPREHIDWTAGRSGNHHGNGTVGIVLRLDRAAKTCRSDRSGDHPPPEHYASPTNIDRGS
jgi:hypothetical protein